MLYGACLRLISGDLTTFWGCSRLWSYVFWGVAKTFRGLSMPRGAVRRLWRRRATAGVCRVCVGCVSAVCRLCSQPLAAVSKGGRGQTGGSCQPSARAVVSRQRGGQTGAVVSRQRGRTSGLSPLGGISEAKRAL